MGGRIHHPAKTVGMDGEQLAQVKTALPKQNGGKRNGEWQAAHAGMRLVHLGKVQCKAGKLLVQIFLNGMQVQPDGIAPLRLAFGQRTLVAIGQALHQLFNAVATQVAAQQHHAALQRLTQGRTG